MHVEDVSSRVYPASQLTQIGEPPSIASHVALAQKSMERAHAVQLPLSSQNPALHSAQLEPTKLPLHTHSPFVSHSPLPVHVDEAMHTPM